jgi:hypothetical protein
VFYVENREVYEPGTGGNEKSFLAHKTGAYQLNGSSADLDDITGDLYRVM